MIDIDEAIKILLEHPSEDFLIYSKNSGKFVSLESEEARLLKKNDFYVLCDIQERYLMAKKVFRAKHKDIFPKSPSSYSFKKWDEIIEKENLKAEWFDELRSSLSESITWFSKHYGIQEVEASDDLYEQIRKELVIFEKKHYEERYSDQVFFHLKTDYEPVPMTILGNAKSVFGVSFYPSEPFGETYLLIQNKEDFNIDPETANALANMVSFYFENDESLPYEFDHNPYGESNHFTSCYLTNGNLMNSYLPKSIAIRSLSYLKEANRTMAIFDKDKHDEVKDNRFYDVYLTRNKFEVMKKDIRKLPYELISALGDVVFKDQELKISPTGALDATIRLLPGYFYTPGLPDRCVHFAFAALLCDHKSGYLHKPVLGEALNFRAFDSLSASLSNALKDITIPKTIYVNNYLDGLFFHAFFAPYIKAKKIKIVITMKSLKTDEAFEELASFLEHQMEEEKKSNLS